MHSVDGRFTMVYNGEIYNYKELRRVLAGEGRIFNTQTDGEVLLQAWIEWGAECLERLEGMFAFVVYDSHRQTISCVRDAFGIKPLFYTNTETGLFFASEVPALLELFGSKPEVNWQRCYDYLVHGDYDSQEESFFEGVSHLLPGHLLEYDLASSAVNRIGCWWKPSIAETCKLSFSDAAEQLRTQFLHNVKLHLRSDVPLGSALSGGIDSSAVVSAIRYLEPDCPIHTFSFIAKNYDISEEFWVDKINSHVRAIPHKVVAGGAELMNDLEDMIRAQGEPFGSTSIFAQYKVFQLAKENGITVTLDGQGADEMLAGYTRYPGQRMLSILEEGNVVELLRFARRWSEWPGRSYLRTWMYFAALTMPSGLYSLAKRVLGHDPLPDWLDRSVLLEAGVDVSIMRPEIKDKVRGRRLAAELADNLTRLGLPGLLRHADRNSMRFAIESRVPFLTIPMVNLLLSLPEEYLISPDGETKSIFRAAMRDIVPDEILDRKDKIGFATPEKDWLFDMQGTVKEWIDKGSEVPFLNHSNLMRHFDAVLAGKKAFSWQVWRWVNFIKWHEMYG